MPAENPLLRWARYHTEAAIFLLSLLAFSATSADRLLRQSQGPHFVYQAHAFLHGRLDVEKPPNDNDWIRYGGKYYVCFPPVPAVLMMPLVAVFGLGFNDVLFTIPFAALNVMLMFMVLQLLARLGLSKLGREENLWLTVLFGFGTVNYACSVLGEVWFTAHVVGLTFTLLYVLAATRLRRPLLAGLALALAFDTRVSLAFTCIYFGLQLVFPRDADGRPAAGSWSRVLRQALLFSLPIVVVGGLQMWMNQARFGNPFEFGHSYLIGPAGERIKAHGLFAYHYLWWNLSTMLCGLPKLLDHFPFLAYDPNGMSIFITTPVLLWLLWPRQRPWLYPLLWATAVAGLLPGLFYQNSGYVQFGYRFALDVMPYLIMLLACGGLVLNRRIKILILVSVAVNLAGAIAFKRSGPV